MIAIKALIEENEELKAKNAKLEASITLRLERLEALTDTQSPLSAQNNRD